MHKWGQQATAYKDIVFLCSHRNSDRIVCIDEFFIRVSSGDVEVDVGSEMGRWGKVERGDFEAGDDKGGSVGSVEDVDNGSGYGSKDYESEDDHCGP